MRTILRGLSACTLAGLAVPLWADDSSSNQYTLEIERQPIVAALTEFSRQTGLQVGYLPRNEREESTIVAPLKGQYTAESAMQELLAPSGLAFERVNERTLAVTAPRSAFERLAFRLAGAGGSAKKTGSWQTVSLDQAESSSGAGGTADSSSVPQRKSGPLEEVVVTAQKREERLKDVPISITVLGGHELDTARLEGVTEALTSVPGVAALTNYLGGSTQVFIRGVGASQPFFGGPSPIAYYMDSVPFGLVISAIAPDQNAYDLQRVEVLRGPQGTLYGASAENGLVRVLTHSVNLNEFELKARTAVSTTDGGGENYRGDVAVNVPIIDGKLAARAVVGYQDLSGWIDNPVEQDANDAELANYRLKIDAQPTQELSIGLSLWSSRSDYGAPSAGRDGDQFDGPIPQPMSTDYDAYGLKLDYDFAHFSISSMTSDFEYTNSDRLDLTVFGTNSAFITEQDSDIFSQEIIVNSTHEGPWRWTAGAFYRDGEDRLFQTQTNVALPFYLDYGHHSESYAIFGEVGRRFLGNKMEWTLGGRYFHDEVVNEENAHDPNDPNLVGAPLYQAKRTFTSTTPRAVLTWYPNEDVTAYASYSEGFRSGFPQNLLVIQVAPDFAALKPDELHNYEIGAKADVLDRRLSFDAAVYYIDWRDIQQVLAVPVGNGVWLSAPINGDSASGIGFDLAVTTRPADGLEMGVTFSWNDLSFDTPVLSQGVVLFEKGARPNFSSKYSGSALIDYSFALGGAGFRGQFLASASYSSTYAFRGLDGTSRYINISDDPLIARASFALISPDRWTATVYADNLNNWDGALPQAAATENLYSRVRPRTVGLQLEYRF